MKEIEAKAKMSDPKRVIKNIEALGCVLSDPAHQHDWIFLEKGTSLADVRAGTNVLRIRKTGDAVFLTLKQRQVNPLNKIEYEVLVDNADHALNMVQLLGYEEAAQVKKTRRKSQHGEYEICVDEVEELGSYIELEKLMPLETDTETENRIQEEMFAFLEDLGIDPSDRARFGYDILIWQKLNPDNVPIA